MSGVAAAAPDNAGAAITVGMRQQTTFARTVESSCMIASRLLDDRLSPHLSLIS